MRKIDSQLISMKSNQGFVYVDKQKSFDKLIQPGDKVQSLSKDGKRRFIMLCRGTELQLAPSGIEVVPTAVCKLIKIKEEEVKNVPK